MLTETVSVESFAAAIVRESMLETFVRQHSLNTLYQSNTLCLPSTYSSRQNKVPIVYRLVSGVVGKSCRLTFIRGKKLSARVFSSDPNREHAQTEQEEAAILLTSARYFIVYLHPTVACRCLLCLLLCLFSSLPVPLGAPVSYFHFRRFFGLVVLRYRTGKR